MPEFPLESHKTVRQSLEGTHSRPWRILCCWVLSQIPVDKPRDVDMSEFDNHHRRCDIRLYEKKETRLNSCKLKETEK